MLVAVAACGYNFRGGTSNLPPDIKAIAIPMFKNNSGEIRVETTITDEVIYQFTRSKMLTVVPEDKADAVLKGVIVQVTVSDVALTSQETSRQRRVSMRISGRLVRTKDKKTVWADRSMTRWETYNVSGSPQADESAKQEALRELAEELARKMHDRVLENF
jgi:TolB-like protein